MQCAYTDRGGGIVYQWGSRSSDAPWCGNQCLQILKWNQYVSPPTSDRRYVVKSWRTSILYSKSNRNKKQLWIQWCNHIGDTSWEDISFDSILVTRCMPDHGQISKTLLRLPRIMHVAQLCSFTRGLLGSCKNSARFVLLLAAGGIF